MPYASINAPYDKLSITQYSQDSFMTAPVSRPAQPGMLSNVTEILMPSANRDAEHSKIILKKTIIPAPSQ